LLLARNRIFGDSGGFSSKSSSLDPARSKLHAFYDTNQSVYGDVTGALASFIPAPIRLTRNLRNTQHVHDVARIDIFNVATAFLNLMGITRPWVAGSLVALVVRRYGGRLGHAPLLHHHRRITPIAGDGSSPSKKMAGRYSIRHRE
jgi:hypothetical protein